MEISNHVRLLILYFLALGCQRQAEPVAGQFQITDANLVMELVSDQIPTPIGLAIDEDDALYVLESHTHTPPKDYQGPSYDRIRKGIDGDQDGIPEKWMIYADSIEDGMNLIFGPEQTLFLTTKNAVWSFRDSDGDGVSDRRNLLLDMFQPESPYDHAAILGLAVSPDNQWLFVSRGNTGSSHWIIEGTDGSRISGYGDGGNVIRCRLDGSEVEEIATGFWNPFDIKFTHDGRLLLSDNDPDSRGPNRLIELVPGGDYGYKSLYGGSGLHPFVAWNGELPGTLPYAAPLGEAPCALLDGAFTGLGTDYQNAVLVNVWEEKKIVRIPLSSQGTSVTGIPEVLVQGDSTFHPVALVSNSRGEVYLTDWVIRQYPNHGKGEIWRLRNKQLPAEPAAMSTAHYRFGDRDLDFNQQLRILAQGDPFQKSMIRHSLAREDDFELLQKLLSHQNRELRLQGLLVFYRRKDLMPNQFLKPLLEDPDQEVRLATLFYIGSRCVTGMLENVEQSLKQGFITPELFEAYLATVQNLQPGFVQGYEEKKVKANQLKRELPPKFIEHIVVDEQLDQNIRGLALPYLDNLSQHGDLLLELLKSARKESFQLSILDAIRSISHQLQPEKLGRELLSVAVNINNSNRVRANALAVLPELSPPGFEQVKQQLRDPSEAVQYAALKYLTLYADDISPSLEEWIEENKSTLPASVQSIWEGHNGNREKLSPEQWTQMVDGQGNTIRGELVFKSRTSQCLTCHKVDGWGGTFGPGLTKIGSSKSQQQLINAVIYPSQEMAPEWQGWFVIDQEGSRHTGRQIDVHLNRVELMNIQGEFEGYKNARSFGVLNESLMPPGLQNTMTLSEFNDLITYLRSKI